VLAGRLTKAPRVERLLDQPATEHLLLLATVLVRPLRDSVQSGDSPHTPTGFAQDRSAVRLELRPVT